MNLDSAEVARISERLSALDNRDKLLASYIAVGAQDATICSEMGYRAHELEQAVLGLCTRLYMTYLNKSTWRRYVRAAVLLVASPNPTPRSAPPRKHRVKREQWKEAEPFIAQFIQEAARTKEPKLAVAYSCVPSLFAYAISLSGKVEEAEDLVQETLTRAFEDIVGFNPTGNLKSSMSAWLFTILRNYHHSAWRHRKREIEDIDDELASQLECLPDQWSHLELEELKLMLAEISPLQREAVLLTAAGYSQEEIAEMVGCLLGTVKSRTNRGRTLLAELTGHIYHNEEAA